MVRRLLAPSLMAVLALAVVSAQRPVSPVSPLFPPRGAWPAADPGTLGFDKARLDEAWVRWLGGGTRGLDQVLGRVLAALEP